MPGEAVCPGHSDTLATTCCFDEDRSQPVREAGLMNGPGAGVLETYPLEMPPVGGTDPTLWSNVLIGGSLIAVTAIAFLAGLLW